jgi:hypothetical protein
MALVDYVLEINVTWIFRMVLENHLEDICTRVFRYRTMQESSRIVAAVSFHLIHNLGTLHPCVCVYSGIFYTDDILLPSFLDKTP